MDRTFARTGQSSLEFAKSSRPGESTFVSTGTNAPGVYGVPEPRVAPVHRIGAPCKTKANITHNPVTGTVGGVARREAILRNQALVEGAPAFCSEYVAEFGRGDPLAGMSEPRPFLRKTLPAEETDPAKIDSFATTTLPRWKAQQRAAPVTAEAYYAQQQQQLAQAQVPAAQRPTFSFDMRDHICVHYPRSAALWPDHKPPLF